MRKSQGALGRTWRKRARARRRKRACVRRDFMREVVGVELSPDD